MESILRAEHVSIGYKIGDFKDIGLKEWTMRRLTGNYHVEVFQAVRDVSFELNKGEMLGIIGSNGAGKSTLLKAVSGIMSPTQGSIVRRGSVAALLELGSGFDADLTVKENAYLRGAMLGYTRQFMDETFGQIIDFAELRGFEDRSFKQLSSGMQARLAFSVASLVDPDILILDEVLSVGDGAFQEKSAAKMQEIISRGAATILVSHILSQVRELCTKILWLDHGSTVAYGTDVEGICDAYEYFLNTGRIELGEEGRRTARERREKAMEKKTNDLAGKKLLILGGSNLHCELVNTARKLGVETYVTDYYPIEKSPAKRIADHAWDLNVTDVDAIAERCREEKIDGVINMYYDSCQRPYQAICERLGLPCFGTREQYEIFTDKKRFLETCVKYGMDIIPQYREEDFAFDNPAIEYPVYVKPADSRGSRGQSICRCYAEVEPAIEKARCESRNGRVVIERFMENALDMQLSCFMIDGKLYIEMLADKYNGSIEENFFSDCICGIAPSQRHNSLPTDVYGKIERMLRELGIRNAPIFLQGFLDKDKFRVYDPALRLPGSFYEKLLRNKTGVDVYEATVTFALTGRFPDSLRRLESFYNIKEWFGIGLFIYLRPGTITKIIGMDLLRERKDMAAMEQHFAEGDRIGGWTYDYTQCFCALVLVKRHTENAGATIREIYETLQVLDDNGEDMKIALFDPEKLRD